MKITWNTDVNAPGCAGEIVAEDGRTLLVQTDWDWPGVAQSFGWQPCPCGRTDGTVDCEHKTASDMIAAAREWLDEHDGAEADDPGYFG